MAEHFKTATTCPFCMAYLEKPMSLKCGYVCCAHCIGSLKQEQFGGVWLCPFCSAVSQKNDIRPKRQLESLVSKIKELEPHLRGSLQMNPRMLKFQVDVTLDVSTANNHLIVFDDLRSVQYGYLEQNREEGAKRFKAVCVLGSSRFTSGCHYWEVDVGTSREWSLGVCKESVDRQEEILSSERGFWTVGLRNGERYSASTTPSTPLLVNPRLHRVGVFLDMALGNISFCDIRDRSHIFTFTHISPKEPLLPFFAPANIVNDGQGFLRIGPR
ncbi:ret finger protein-like 3 [Dasypus novemcinctus]|uniref:ret finger protein-like 3 n=1 Tax=Dasypus novemcinctus TaxID=9361 RepID=UPI00265E3166|nr:ret finger protein-like 3 [Dasypus novemcinctus]